MKVYIIGAGDGFIGEQYHQVVEPGDFSPQEPIPEFTVPRPLEEETRRPLDTVWLYDFLNPPADRYAELKASGYLDDEAQQTSKPTRSPVLKTVAEKTLPRPDGSIA